jgi:hypothetical protein
MNFRRFYKGILTRESFLLVYIPAIPAISVFQAIMPRSYTMFQSNEISVTKIVTTDSDHSTSLSPANTRTAVTARDSTKDAGRVHIGGGMMRFHTTKDAGRVHVGGGMMRF